MQTNENTKDINALKHKETQTMEMKTDKFYKRYQSLLFITQKRSSKRGEGTTSSGCFSL